MPLHSTFINGIARLRRRTMNEPRAKRGSPVVVGSRPRGESLSIIPAANGLTATPMAIDYIPHRGVRRSQIGSKSWHVFLFCALMLAKSGVSALAAEDPARFFQVTKWIGTFDRI